MNWTKTTSRGDDNHLSFVIWCHLYQRFYSISCILKIFISLKNNSVFKGLRWFPPLYAGDDLNSVSFTAGHSKGSFVANSDPTLNQSLSESWSFYKFVGGGQTGVTFPTTVLNPNKAVVTIDAKTSEVNWTRGDRKLFHFTGHQYWTFPFW